MFSRLSKPTLRYLQLNRKFAVNPNKFTGNSILKK